MHYQIQPVTAKDAEELATWAYPPPYEIYNLSVDVIPIMLNPLRRYFSVKDEDDQIAGYCCFGQEAKVMGGGYERSEPAVLDIGVGMHPDRVGKGEGSGFVEAILQYALQQYKTEKIRVTIAEFNKRSLKTFLSLGFEETYRFERPCDDLIFIQLERRALMDAWH
jgi:ribosomal-protein-alanine N-acetyltransferase